MKLSLALTALLVFAVPASAADSEMGAVSEAHIRGSVSQTGPLEFMSLYAQDSPRASAGFYVDAAAVHGRWYHETGYAAPPVGTPAGDFSAVTVATETDELGIGSAEEPIQFASVASIDLLDSFRFNIASVGDGAEITTKSSDQRASIALGAVMDWRGIQSSENQIPASDDEQFFRSYTSPLPLIVSDELSSKHKLTVIGDFVMEIYGAEVEMVGNGLESTRVRTGLELSDGNVPSYELGFLRLTFEDATLTFSRNLFAEDMQTQWATPSGHLDSEHARIMLPGGDEIRAPFTMLAQPTMDGLVFTQLTEESPQALAASVGSQPNALLLLWLLAPVAVLAGLFAVLRVPSMPAIERSLAAGLNNRAARQASRRIRRNPSDESARLSRAIAFSRGGEPKLAVEELEGYLSSHEPNDGTLHYVLSIAYKDLGRTADAAKARIEAGRLTPALARPTDAQAYA